MANNLLITFIILNIINVIIQTVKSLATVKCGKVWAAIVNALAYGFYTIVVVYMVCELPLMTKVIIVGLCNLVGVYLVKLLEEKGRKDKIWKVEFSTKDDKELLVNALEENNISYNYITTSKKEWHTFNIYCKDKKQSHLVKELCSNYNGKFFVTETKYL